MHRARKPRGRICRSATKGTGEKMAQRCWLSPELVAQIWLNEQKPDHFRHAKFVELRADKDRKDVRRETGA
jgi:hypothetical protein